MWTFYNNQDGIKKAGSRPSRESTGSYLRCLPERWTLQIRENNKSIHVRGMPTTGDDFIVLWTLLYSMEH